jgi:hypothetical protein
VPSQIDFFGLSRPVQDRFAAATRRSAPPAPLLFHRAARTSAWVLLALSVLLLGIEGALLPVGWGDARSPLALHRPPVLAVDIGLLAAATYCILRSIGILLTLDARPWTPGLYLFPGCVVDARGRWLLVWPMADVTSVEPLGRPKPGVVLRMRDGSQVVVPAPSPQLAERAEAALEPLRRELTRALESGDSHALAELDPLHDLAVSSPIGPTERMKPEVALWIRLDWLIAALVGGALGYGLVTTRNIASDEGMLRAAVAAGTVSAYQEYLARAGAHVPEVSDVLLPRALLREAEGQGTIEAVRAFADSHRGSKIAPEIDAALRRATLAELERAKRAGTVSALDEFARRYPDHHVDAELGRARHALFTKALAAWRATARPDPGVSAFVERLISWAEKTGQPCAVRFRAKPSTSMEGADKSAISSGHYPGPDALPSHYVALDALRPREARVERAVAGAFAAAFPPDILAFRAGPALAVDEPAPTDTPTLLIDYSPEWSHGNTASTKPNTVFAGIIFTFDAVFALPEGAPWKLSVKAWRGAEAWKVRSEGLSREEFEQKVYAGMIDSAFDQLQKRILDAFF